jgi:hypothetical protein
MPCGVMRYKFTAKVARTRNQSFCRGVFPVVHSRRRKFLKHVHNLFTRFVVVLASWLETRNQLRKRQEKNEFNFELQQKKFLTGKRSARLHLKTETVCQKNFARAKPRPFRNPRGEESSVVIPRASRVDRTGLCAQFSASASGGQTLTKL